jgi:hypothetical protein
VRVGNEADNNGAAVHSGGASGAVSDL